MKNRTLKQLSSLGNLRQLVLLLVVASEHIIITQEYDVIYSEALYTYILGGLVVHNQLPLV